MPEVDPDDDDIERWVVRWYRYDPARRQRRHVTVAAFSTQVELEAKAQELWAEVQERRATGTSEQCEHITGVCMPPGYRAAMARQRIASPFRKDKRRRETTP